MSEKAIIKSVVAVCIAAVAIAMILAHLPVEALVGLGMISYLALLLL